MGVRFYDEAVVDKIKRWVKDPNLKILKPNEVTRLFQMTIDENKDSKLKLPLVAISRDPSLELLSNGKKPLSYDGKLLESKNGVSKSLNAIPIKITYQLDIYTRYYDEGDEYIRNFVFNLINYPKLLITIPYNESSIIHSANIQLLSNIEDNSDIPQRIFSGQFTRWTLKFTVDDAYLFSVPFDENVSIVVDDIDYLEISNDR